MKPSMKQCYKTGVATAVLFIFLLIPAYYLGSIPGFKGVPAFNFVADARDQLLKTAMVISADLPIVPGSNPDHRLQVAGMLHAIASDIRGRQSDPAGIVEPDEALAQRLAKLMEEAIKPVVRASLKGQVDTIFKKYIK